MMQFFFLSFTSAVLVQLNSAGYSPVVIYRIGTSLLGNVATFIGLVQNSSPSAAVNVSVP